MIRSRLGTAIDQAALELVHRNTEEQYWEYVKRLAAEAGIDPDDTKAVRRFDRNREGRKTSNEEWVNPHGPDAKDGMTKHGACDMIYKPEHVTDLESGVIVAAEVRCGDEGDTVDLAARVLLAGETLARVCDDPEQAKVLPRRRNPALPDHAFFNRLVGWYGTRRWREIHDRSGLAKAVRHGTG